jgi:hypothetical protein
LAPTVGTDLGRLRRLAGRNDPEAWRQGLALVRGRPFDGLLSPDWAVIDGAVADAEETVVGLAVRLADHLLVVGDPDRAARAVRRGLLASPYDERLFRRLLRAADAQGNPAGVESVMAELALRLCGEANPRDSITAGVHPDTAELYLALSQHRVAGRPAPWPSPDSTCSPRSRFCSPATEEAVGRL